MVASDIFIMKSTAVFSLLGRDGDHIRTDYGFAGAFLSFTQVVVLRDRQDDYRAADGKFRSDDVSRSLPGGLARTNRSQDEGAHRKPREIAAPPPVIDSHDRLETQPGAGSIRFEAHRAEEGARSAPAGPLAARSRGSETESTDRRRAHHSRPKAAKTSNCLIRTPFLRHLSRRVVRVEIGQKPGVVRGTGSSNPSPSSGESCANRCATRARPASTSSGRFRRS